MSPRTIRVFPRRTEATPTDTLAFSPPSDMPPLWAEADAVHISVAFTDDLARADQLANEWRHVAPVTVGGPATGAPGGDFIPGQYLAPGYVITSRGCPNRCWFCSVWRREGSIVRELPIRAGNNVLDDNLLACSREHIEEVFAMLARQTARPMFTGGLEAARLRPWHCSALRELRPTRMYFAYDTPDDYDPLLTAGKMLRAAGITATSHVAACYVLVGYPQDSVTDATVRLIETCRAGFWPMAMLWNDYSGHSERPAAWRAFQREWARPQIIGTKFREHYRGGTL